jgi:hypothetical protein
MKLYNATSYRQAGQHLSVGSRKELKPNERIQRVETEIIKNKYQSSLTCKALFSENKNFINPQLIQKAVSKVYYI